MQLEYFIIGGCTIQVLLSHIKPRVVFQFHNLPCVSFRWWISIPLVVRYVFRVRVHKMVIHITVSLFLILTLSLFVKGGKVREEI